MKLKQLRKETGFTLLELLVVVALIATISVGALVAYEGAGDNAQATAATNNTASVDKIMRTYRAVSLKYPNQYDNLATPAAVSLLNDNSKNVFGQWNIGATAAADVRNAVLKSFETVGINELQQINVVATGLAPNLQHNEGANPGAAEVEWEPTAADPNVYQTTPALENISIVPTARSATTICNAGGVSISNLFAVNNATPVTVNNGNTLNRMNDSLDADECHLVVAVGFGHDAAHSTTGSAAAAANAPTYVSTSLNPNQNYARFIALFHLGSDTNENNNIEAGEIFAKARFIGVLDTEGKDIDSNAALMTASN